MFPLSVPYRNIAIAVAAVLLIIGIYTKGRLDEKEKFDAYKVEVASAAAAQEAKIAELTKTQQRINKETSDAYKIKLSATRNYYNRLFNTGSGPVSVIPDAAPGVNGYPAYAILAGQCAETTIQLTSLQSWIKEINNASEEISK